MKEIQRETIWRGRQAGKTWFHPRAGKLPDGSVLMTCQDITGSDNFGQVHWSRTFDNGVSWSEPQPVEAFQRTAIGDGYEEGVCDAVPEYHAPSGKVLLMGHNVFYKNDALFPGAPPGYRGRHSVYCVGDIAGDTITWGPRHELEWDDPRTTECCMCGCAQRYTLENGDVLVPLYFAPAGRPDRSVTTVLFAFDGETLHFKKAGRELRLEVKRGLLEPSITCYKSTFYLTIRAEDDRGYFAISTDGLDWGDMIPWAFDDGELLVMSTTQQRWLQNGDELYLVYTRKTPENTGVMRWRAPLFIAQFDPQRQCLIRATEQIVFPMDGDGTAPGDLVARMGNFHTTRVSSHESWVTVGESRPHHQWRGDTLLARIKS